RRVLNDEIQNDILNVHGVIYDTRVSPVFNPSGKKTGYMGVSIDITDRVKTEKKLEKFRHVLDQAPGAVFIMDRNRNFEYINPYFTQMSGYTPDELLYKNIGETLYKNFENVPESRNGVTRALLDGKNWQGELLTISKNGNPYWANTIAARQNPGDHVDHGQTIPAVTAPFGMTQWTLQTNATEKKCLSPFYFGDLYLQGFRATHWTSGSCVQDYGSFTVFPTSFSNDFQFLPDQRKTPFTLENQNISPACFTTTLAKNQIIAEITATQRAGFFRFTWEKKQTPAIIIDVNSDEGEGYIKIDMENQEIAGYNPVHRIYNGMGKPAGFSGYFVAKFNKKFTGYGTFAATELFRGSTEQKNKPDIGAYVTFDSIENETLKMKMGTSFTSIENARKNLETEITGWDFEKCKNNLEKTWNKFLGRIDVEGGTSDDSVK
ncbi:MAG: PAS domain S-box protein, partial [Bacteroidia bacterium]|nr:PAS domain S-box protein [Bacteroidia bacterium]